MPELRWTLLILGALFIAGLAIWEFRRQRHARGQSMDKGLDRSIDPRFGEASDESARFNSDGPRAYREPTLTLPDVHVDSHGGIHTAGANEPRRAEPRADARRDMRQEMRDRDPMAELPVVEIEDKELAGLRVDDDTAVDSFSMHAEDERDDVAHGDADELRADVDDEKPATAAPMVPRLAPAEPMIAERRFNPSSPSGDARESATEQSGVFAAARSGADSAAGTAGDANLGSDFDEGVLGPARVVGEAPAYEPMHANDESSGSQPAPATKPFDIDADAFAIKEPIVEWPEDETRKIIALRLVSGGGDRFSGRTVRQALAAEGFLLGKFDIFHKPGPDARAVLSAASLTKPGTFSLSTMDTQRFGGLSLFAVLPGPLSPTATFDELLITARSLNDRLRGALQDERGEPLTPVRSASIRDSLTAQATAAAPVVGPASGASPTTESDAPSN